MIRIDLNRDFYLKEQVLQLTKDLNDAGYDVTEKTVMHLVRGDLPISNTMNMKSSKKRISIDDIIVKNITGVFIEDCLIGAAAVRYLFRLADAGTETVPLDMISIDTDVFDECSSRIWYDISNSAASVARFTASFERLSQHSLPVAVAMSNYVHTWKALNRLNDNSGDDADVRADGTAIRSLSDVGYSLISGWNDDMKAYFEKQEAEEEEMSEKELFEEEEEDEEENDDD